MTSSRPTRTVGAIALRATLLASIGANGLLLADFVTTWHREPQDRDSKDVALPSAVPLPLGERGVRAESKDGCEDDVVDLRQQLDDLRHRIEQNQPLADRFAAGAPNHRAVTELRPIIERVLGGDAGVSDFSVECRASVCEVSLPPEAVPTYDWHVALYRSLDFATRVGEDAKIGRAKFMFSLREQASGESKGVLINLVRSFKDGDALDRCWSAHREAGRLDAVVWIGESEEDEPSEGREIGDGIWLRLKGALTGTGTEKCIVDELTAMASRVKAPAHRAVARVPTFFEIPRRRLD
jgi:hypothetical protein